MNDTNQRLLTEGDFLLEKYPGKGGWTYLIIPSLNIGKGAAFGFLRVNGAIDEYVLKGAGLWKAKKGGFFLPVKAAIRKAIGKAEGDMVHLKLFSEDEALQSETEITDCLRDEPLALKNFRKLSSEERKKEISWILSGRTEKERVERIADLINVLLGNKRH